MVPAETMVRRRRLLLRAESSTVQAHSASVCRIRRAFTCLALMSCWRFELSLLSTLAVGGWKRAFSTPLPWWRRAIALLWPAASIAHHVNLLLPNVVRGSTLLIGDSCPTW